MGKDAENGRGGDAESKNIVASGTSPCPLVSLISFVSPSLSLCSLGERLVWGCNIWQKYRSTVRMLTLLACLRWGMYSLFA